VLLRDKFSLPLDKYYRRNDNILDLCPEATLVKRNRSMFEFMS